jgi:hypothetical protein
MSGNFEKFQVAMKTGTFTSNILEKLPEELKTWKLHFDWKLSVKRHFS